MEKKKKLFVHLYGKSTGILFQTNMGKMQFQYLPEAEQALSLSMPFRQEPFDEVICEAYFGGLLPESELTRKAIGKQFGINYENSFSLLSAIGHECAGAVSIYQFGEPEELIDEVQGFVVEGIALSETELAKKIRELPQKPLFMAAKDMRISLAGVQDKAAVSVIDDKVTIPFSGHPTTHILKPAMPVYKDSVLNEYFCLKLAKSMGLMVPHAEIRQAEDLYFLLIERYDRKYLRSGKLHRIHQEDFCQALGIISTNKYQADGGPGFKESFGLLVNSKQPAVDRNQLLSYVIFNYLIGNSDAHGKNFSLLHQMDKQIRLAPLYDVMCTSVYSGITNKMAMKIASSYLPETLMPRHWEQFCESIGFSFPIFKEILQKQINILLNNAEVEYAKLRDYHSDTLSSVMKFIDKRCELLKRRFGY